MNRLSRAKPLLAAVLGIAALVGASAAHARSDVHFSIGIQAPFGVIQPAPVYVQPQPVYVEPAPVYVQPQPVYVQPQPVYVQPQPVYHRHGHSHGWRGPWGDADRDGVPNRYDRRPNNPYRY
jgi:hypothetical protein